MTIQPAKVSPTKLAYKLQPMSVSWSGSNEQQALLTGFSGVLAVFCRLGRLLYCAGHAVSSPTVPESIASTHCTDP